MAADKSKRGHVPPPLQHYERYSHPSPSTSSSTLHSFGRTDRTTPIDSATRQESQSPQELSPPYKHNHSDNENRGSDSMMASTQAEVSLRARRQELLSGILIPLIFIVAVLPLYPRLAAFPSQSILGHLTHAIALSFAILISITWYANRKNKASRGSFRDPRGNIPKPTSRHVMRTAFALISRAFGLLLPFFAASELGGVTVAFSLLLVASSSLEGMLSHRPDQSTLRTMRKNKFTLSMILLTTLFHYAYLGPANKRSPSVWGYLALYVSMLVLPSPLLPSSPALKPIFPTNDFQPSGTLLDNTAAAKPSFTSSLIKTPVDVELSKTAGYALFAVWMILSIFQHGMSLAWLDGILTLLSGTAAIVASELWIRPKYLQTPKKYGVAAGCICVTISSIFLSPGSGLTPVLIAGLCGLGYAATFLDRVYLNPTSSQSIGMKPPRPKKTKHQTKKISSLTKYLLSRTSPGSILHSILREKESRRIAYFACLNLGFMIVQFFYGFVTGSLGLLTDSIHMLFDCMGLGLGLAAAVMSKWAPSLGYPLGYAKIGVLAGFANAISLVVVSVEIVVDAIHRLEKGHEVRRLNELLAVSILGFLVNIVGLFAFGHAHHGHDHGHDHGHNHGHDHGHDHGHAKSHKRRHSGHDHSHRAPSPPQSPLSVPSKPVPSADATHISENMQGIFLHILADTLGSFAVIISTLLTMRNSWYGWDPIASSFITILILVSAYPLIKNTSKSLMGNMPDNIDYEIRELLRGITQLRGVVGYKAVKFYVYDAEGDGIAHEHTHDHSADEKHAHDHDHLDHHDMNLAQPCYPPGYTGSDPNHSDSDHSDRFPYAPLQVDKHHIYGTLHVYAAKGISVMDVYEKVDEYVRSRGFEMNLQIERHGAKPCWCTRKKT